MKSNFWSLYYFVKANKVENIKSVVASNIHYNISLKNCLNEKFHSLDWTKEEGLAGLTLKEFLIKENYLKLFLLEYRKAYRKCYFLVTYKNEPVSIYSSDADISYSLCKSRSKLKELIENPSYEYTRGGEDFTFSKDWQTLFLE